MRTRLDGSARTTKVRITYFIAHHDLWRREAKTICIRDLGRSATVSTTASCGQSSLCGYSIMIDKLLPTFGQLRACVGSIMSRRLSESCSAGMLAIVEGTPGALKF
jgi:hypothetical protein